MLPFMSKTLLIIMLNDKLIQIPKTGMLGQMAVGKSIAKKYNSSWMRLNAILLFPIALYCLSCNPKRYFCCQSADNLLF